MVLHTSDDENCLDGALFLHEISEAAGSACPSVYRALVVCHKVPAPRTFLVLELGLSFRRVKVIELSSSGLMLLLCGLLLTHQCSLATWAALGPHPASLLLVLQQVSLRSLWWA